MNVSYFEPFTFPSGVTIKNRILMAPMTTNSLDENGWVPQDDNSYYSERAEYTGAIITGSCHVNNRGRQSNSIDFTCDESIEPLKHLTSAVHEKGGKIFIQLFHAGRMTSSTILNGEKTVGPSAIPSTRIDAEVPHELSHNEIINIIKDFGQATRRAIEAGFDGIELHGANTYLLQQFFSPHSNQRTDYWGGSLHNRTRFILAVINKCKEVINKHTAQPFVIGYRFSPEEIEEPGITFSDTLFLLKILSTMELDYLHISLGDYKRKSLRDTRETRSIIEEIITNKDIALPLIAVGGIKNKQDLEYLENMQVPLLAIGRSLLVDPKWPKNVMEETKMSKEYIINLQDAKNRYLPKKLIQYLKENQQWIQFL